MRGGMRGVSANSSAGGSSNVYRVDDEESCDDQEVCEECHNFSIRYVSEKPILLDVILGNVKLSMEVDSGSGVCVISDTLYREKFSNYKLTKSNVTMCMYSGHKISPLGYFLIKATYKKIY